MLERLHIVDFAIIDEAELALGQGLNVLTGETGAGKSIIVGAAAVLRGGRVSSALVRSGRAEAVVEALYDLSSGAGAERTLELIREAGLPAEGTELLVRRVIPRGGRARVYVNGALCTAAVLSRVAGPLLDISGQHEHQLLSDSATHRRLLDAFGTPAKALREMEQAHRELREAAERLTASQMGDRQRAERIDYLRFQVDELSAAALAEGEDLQLEQELRRLSRSGELIELAVQGEQELYSGEGALADRLARLQGRLEALSSADASLTQWSSQLGEARVLVEDVAQSLSRYAGGVELDPDRLSAVEERLDLIHRLCRKHGVGAVDELRAREQEMARELESLESLDERLDDLQRELDRARGSAGELAQKLGAARKKAARRLGREVSRVLQDLRMEGARLEVQLSELPAREGDPPALRFGASRRLGPAGWDRVEFVIRTNAGEDLQPLGQIASGGELSRIMLGLRRTLGEHDPVNTSIYDEVDAGVGGAVADVVGRSLAEVARHRQVICVTHLPQVAAYADHHFHVGKERRGRRTVTRVERLGQRERIAELARMLGGEEVSRGARQNARQLMEAARRHK
jgi:DNA repair protein RecN (Recombination protein N)